MNIFLPFRDFKECAKVLDDKRLNKQILECKQIVKMIEKKSIDSSYKNPYLNHPVVKNYVDQLHYVVEYGLDMCREYEYRFEKVHKCYYWLLNHLHFRQFDFMPIYVEGSKNSPNCIREEDETKVYELFRNKLCKKWCNSPASTKWTKRGLPQFLKNHLKEKYYEQTN